MKFIYTFFVIAIFATVKGQVYNNAFKISSSGTDRGMRVTTDNSGNVITTGYFGNSADFDPGAGSASLTPSGLSEDVYVAKYDAALNYIWAVKFSTSGSDFPYALAVDASNNIIVGGDVAANSRDGFVNKYDPNGNLTWSISIGGVNKDVVYGVNTDASKNVYVTGYFSNTVDFDPSAGTYTLASNGGRDIFLAKYDSTGKFRWVFNLGGTITTAYEEGGQDLVIAGSNIYLTGNFEGTADFDPSVATNTLMSNGSLDMFIAKYDTTGAYIWAKSMGSNNKHDYSYAIDIDASENVYITGGFEETVDFDPSVGTATLASASVNAQDIFVAKYNSAGAYQWVFQVGGNTSVDDHAFDIDVTPTGDIYICGEVWGPADFDPSAGIFNILPSNDQIFFAKYTNAGAFVWAFDIGATSSNGSADNGFGVHAATAGLYVTGDFSGTADFDPSANTATLTSSGGDAFVALYGTSVFSGINTFEKENDLVKVFPNPSNGQIHFSYAGNKKPWDLSITDVTGKIIFNSKNIQQETISLNLEDLRSGLYFYTIQSNDNTVTKRFIIQ